VENLVRKEKVDLQEARRLFYNGKSLRLFLSYFLLGRLYRIFLEKGYFWKIIKDIRDVLFGSREFIENFSQEKFGKFLEKQKDVLSETVYRKALRLARKKSSMYGWVVMALLLKFTKPVSYAIRFFGISGFFVGKVFWQGMDKFSDSLVLKILAVFGLNIASLSGFWGWLILSFVQFILLWTGIGALYKPLLIWLVAWVFRLRFTPRIRAKNRLLVVRILLDCLNAVLTLFNLVAFLVFGAVNCLLFVTYFSVEIIGSISPERKDFWLLFLIIWQASVRAGVSKASFGVWQGITGQFLWGVFLIDPMTLAVNTVFGIYEEDEGPDEDDSAGEALGDDRNDT
jgi:hypothetical protein